MDSFIPREDISHSSLKALPRGIVSHWLSGNVPLLGMFALIQSILTKNANILKVSANESQALPFLLETFEDLKYTTPGGYSIDGNELLKTLSVVYFDRNQTNIANTFSKNADVRIAWGGREAIESVCSLPKIYLSRYLVRTKNFNDGHWKRCIRFRKIYKKISKKGSYGLQRV